ncbi:MAG: zinc-ribbon domain-containing protein [Butyricicoccus sp.]|nr:zinc-ribbon domain-containing protein [Butyricicoccus sp.]MDY4087091.1 zinc-ribbon domain-containing protein [Butyricicoccus intestinisimiae]
MYCIRCGKQLADGTKYCIYCGAPTAAPKKDEHVSTEDDFTIAVPKGYVQSDASGMDATQHISFGKDFVPDPAEEYMPEGLQDEIGQVIDEELGEREQAEHEYTRAVSREDLARAMEQARPDEDSELQQYVQDVMTSEHTRPAERETAAPEQPEIEDETKVFAADIQEILAQREQAPKQEPGVQPQEDKQDTDELLKQYVQEVMAESGREMPPEADEIEDEGYTRAIAREDIHQAMHAYAQQPTRIISKEEIQEAKQAEPEPDETEQTSQPVQEAEDAQPIESEAYTQVLAKEDIKQAIEQQQTQHKVDESVFEDAVEQQPIEVESIPDIPIPTDFVATEQAEQPPMEKPPRRNRIKRKADLEDEDDGPEQLISGRGIAAVVVIVILLFALAVGACVMALNSGGAADTGSGSGDVGFSYGQSDSEAKG